MRDLTMRCPICTGRVAFFTLDISTGKATCPRCRKSHDRRQPSKQETGRQRETVASYRDAGDGI